MRVCCGLQRHKCIDSFAFDRIGYANNSSFGNDNVQKLKNERDFRALIKRLKKVTMPELVN